MRPPKEGLPVNRRVGRETCHYGGLDGATVGVETAAAPANTAGDRDAVRSSLASGKPLTHCPPEVSGT